jgi:AcrR family transcriptional regulator
MKPPGPAMASKSPKTPKTPKTPRPARPRAGKRARNKEETREKILAAALELFRKKGIAATTTREISRKAGIAEGTLFNYFETKEDLALYFFQKGTDDVIAWYAGEKRLRAAPFAERLFAIIQRQLDYITPYEDFVGASLFRALQPASKLNPLRRETREVRERSLNFVREVFAEAEAMGEIPRLGDMGVYGFSLYYIGVVAHWLHDPSPGKERTLAFLDRSLKLGTALLQKGGWSW